jgi:murein DD-endopeptidase MepM/ murein hydrolase activator NlpD
MFVNQRSSLDKVEYSVRPLRGAALVRPAVFAAGLAALAASGCSTDITRFDQPSFALNDSSSSSVRRYGATRAAETPAYDQVIAAPPPSAPPGSPSQQYANLPAAQPGYVASVAPAPKAPRAVANPAMTAPRPAAKGQQVEVQAGDSLYTIAKRNNVMISELMAVNELANPTIKPGQKLFLPVVGHPLAAAKPAQVAAVAPRAQPIAQPYQVAPQVVAPVRPALVQPVAATAPLTGEWSGSYTVKQGDSLYQIASQHGVKLEELQRVNGITDIRKLQPGAAIKVPASKSAAERAVAVAPVAAAVAPVMVAARTDSVADTAAAPVSRDLKIINGSSDVPAAAAERQAERQASAEPAEPAGLAAGKAVSGAKLRWPVQGRIVQGFGARPDGTQNDGVDLAVPMGTDVLSAEAGTVAYAGNEVKTYGNLVLIRHDNGLVTAYAYNDQILVQRGDRVKRGQPIAKAGKTGNVDQPQLHFEVRVGTKPVDPMPYLEKM